MSDNRTISTVTVANSSVEAMAAYVAEQLFPAHKKSVERQLQGFVYAADLSAKKLDVAAKFEQQCHTEGFVAEPQGALWQVTWEDDASKQTSQITLPYDAAHMLHQLNDAQTAWNMADLELSSMRRRLFCDWHKYMECAYPAKGVTESLPDKTDVKEHLETMLLQLAQKQGNLKVYEATLVDTKLTLNQYIDKHNQSVADNKYQLRAVGAPRYYRAQEPAVLLAGNGLEAGLRHGSGGQMTNSKTLVCSTLADTVVHEDGLGCFTADAFERIFAAVDLLCPDHDTKLDKVRDGFHWHKSQAWHPFRMDWQATVYPVTRFGKTSQPDSDFDPRFIESNFALQADQPDLTTKQEALETRAVASFTGSTLLTGHAKPLLNQAIIAYIRGLGQLALDKVISLGVPGSVLVHWKAWLSQWPGDGQDDVFELWLSKAPATSAFVSRTPPEPPLLAITAFNFIRSSHTLSQVLGGFNDGLLMHNQALQLPIADPLGDTDLAARVANAVQGESKSAPLQQNTFLPIRSGVMTLDKVDVVDTFGQVHSGADTKTLLTPEQSRPSALYDDGRSRVWLSPRVVQPSRLNFRWLSAGDGDVEMNSHPSTTPVCGWLLPNLMDNSLRVFDGDGTVLGEIDQNADWLSVPGCDAKTDIQFLKNTHLQQVIKQLTGDKQAFFARFTEVLSVAQENIDPENSAHHDDISCLLGKPLAIVRATLSLQLKGEAAINHSWQAFEQTLNTYKIDADAVEQVRFPIRIGETGQFNEGTIGFWLETKGLLDGHFQTSAPMEQQLAFGDQSISPYDAQNPVLTLTMGQSKTLTLLVDPHGCIHASSGILPVKQIQLPTEQIKPAMDKMAQVFLARPILTSGNNIEMPLQQVPGASWSYLYKHKQQWQQISEQGQLDKSVLLEAVSQQGDVVWQALQSENWITSTDNDVATVLPKEGRRQPMSALLKKHQQVLAPIFDLGTLRCASTAADFNQDTVYREGWLQLKRDQT